MTSYVRAPLNFNALQRATVGDQKISFTNFDHLGWLKCDGRLVSRHDYALLFNVIGTTFGAGDGTTTFRLPNYQGCVPGMAGQPVFNQGINSTSYARGDTAGTQTHTLTIDQMPRHRHGSTDTSTTGNIDGNGQTGNESAHTHNYQDAYFAEAGGSGPNTIPGSGDTDTDNGFRWRTQAGGTSSTPSDIQTSAGTAHFHSIGLTGGSSPHNNMQPTLFGGNMFIFTGLMYTGRQFTYGSTTGGLNTFPYAQGTDLA